MCLEGNEKQGRAYHIQSSCVWKPLACMHVYKHVAFTFHPSGHSWLCNYLPKHFILGLQKNNCVFEHCQLSLGLPAYIATVVVYLYLHGMQVIHNT